MKNKIEIRAHGKLEQAASSNGGFEIPDSCPAEFRARIVSRQSTTNRVASDDASETVRLRLKLAEASL